MKKFQTVCSSSFFINYELLLLHSRCYRLCYQFVTSLLPVCYQFQTSWLWESR